MVLILPHSFFSCYHEVNTQSYTRLLIINPFLVLIWMELHVAYLETQVKTLMAIHNALRIRIRTITAIFRAIAVCPMMSQSFAMASTCL